MNTPSYIKPRNWNGKDLKGSWQFTLKIDGVRALWTGNGWVSRKGKPLYNIPYPYDGVTDIEAYAGSLKDTLHAVRSYDEHRMLQRDQMYSLWPLDDRLLRGIFGNPTAHFINWHLKQVRASGGEGLVLRNKETGKVLKVKGKDNHDVKITGFYEGKGKHVGRLGGFETNMGDVGTGMTDAQREEFWTTPGLLGETIEVECMELTDKGKFRHARFVRIRFDK
jgi:ATP-dependent DNA ligase